MREIMEEELVYGALRREKQWKALGLGGAAFGVLGCLAAAAVAILDVDPPPALVPYDPATGLALPNATVAPVSLQERPAIIEAQVFGYVMDREVYNQVDNDMRVRRVLSQSGGGALGSMQALWTSGHDEYPPTRYGTSARLDVEILSIALIPILTEADSRWGFRLAFGCDSLSETVGGLRWVRRLGFGGISRRWICGLWLGGARMRLRCAGFWLWR